VNRLYREHAIRFSTLLSVALLISCSSPSSIKPFTTDGCSLFPDKSLIGKKDWCDCCLTHDVAYWRGGTAEERLQADKALQACVENTTGNKALAELMLVGVRSGGGPYYFTTYRWGYGWPFGREYKALAPEERAAADKAEQAFRRAHPQMTCEDAMHK
jgi:hypothetical protein